jgi:hypothetical protein
VNDGGIQRDLGYHDAKIELLESKVDRLGEKLDDALEILNSHQGGFRALVAVGSVAGLMGAAIAEIATGIFGSRHP